MHFKPSYVYIAGIAVVVTVATLIQLPLNQIVSITCFLGIILGAIFFWRFRVAFALVGVAFMMLLGVMDVPQLIESAHFDVILFLFGMMTVIGFLEERGFFEHMLSLLFKYFSRDGRTLVTGLLILSCMFAALVDEVTSILFITALTLRLTKRYKLDVLPMIIATVMATNIGSSYTVIGNPIGVLIAFEGHLTFLDFIRWAMPVGLAVLGLTIVLVWIYWKPYIKTLDERMKTSKANPTSQVEVSKEVSLGEMKIPWIVFLTTIISLVMHHPLEVALNLPTNSLLITFPLLMAGISLLISGGKAREIVEKRVEWWTLAFFIFFFTSVGTLVYTGLANRIAEGTVSATGGNPIVMLTMITWLAGILSAFMDNILAVATLLSVVHGLEATGFNVFSAYWGLLFGACYLGNLTMIGSTANIVALGIIERERKRYINFLDWVKPGLVIAVPQLALATVLLLIMHV